MQLWTPRENTENIDVPLIQGLVTFSSRLLCGIKFTMLVRVTTYVRFTTLFRVTHSNPSFSPVPLVL